MEKWRVRNTHPEGLTHREKFRDEMIEIPAGKYVEMDYEDAVAFRGQYFPMKKRPDGSPDPAGFKCIVIEPASKSQGVSTAPKKFICHFDGKEFPSQTMLDAYIKENYSEHTFKDDALDEEIQKQVATAPKRGPGRPPKEKTA